MAHLDIETIARIHPSPRQLAWQQLEFYAFIHFSLNTYTDQEWGDGREDPSLFMPDQLDADQWVDLCKAAGMRGLILTCKHHGGFCLWPSRYTDYSVKASPWKQGQGDLVRDVSRACRRAGIKFGVYLSPWDRHEASYGDSHRYNQYFLNQLTELLTGYGELFSVWFDGACGEGPNGKRQVYDWEAYYALIRRLQPKAVISICGPDVRWCGNEAGICRPSEWSVVPASLLDQEKIQTDSQQSPDPSFRTLVRSDQIDLGSRAVIAEAGSLAWYPAEVDTSIRPGWFYHESEDDQVRSVETLHDIYHQSVGGNASLLLNLPPDRSGRIHPHDAQRLIDLGQTIAADYAHDLADTAAISADYAAADEQGGTRLAEYALSDQPDLFWAAPPGQETACLDLNWPQAVQFNRVILMEQITEGQRIESFECWFLPESSCSSVEKNGPVWEKAYQGTVVGYKKICLLPPIHTSRLQIRITASRWCATLARVQVFAAETGRQ